MRLLIRLIFLTFVLNTNVYAAPTQDVLPSQRNAQDELMNLDSENKKSTYDPREGSTQISYPDTYNPREQIHITPEQKIQRTVKQPIFDLGHLIYLGASAGYFTDKNSSKNLTVFGFQTKWDFSPDRTLEWDFMMSMQQVFGVGLGTRWPFTSTTRSYPYGKVSVTNFLQASEFLASLVNYNHFKLQGHLGYNNLSLLDEIVQAEFTLGLGMIGIDYSVQVGWRF